MSDWKQRWRVQQKMAISIVNEKHVRIKHAGQTHFNSNILLSAVWSSRKTADNGLRQDLVPATYTRVTILVTQVYTHEDRQSLKSHVLCC